MADVYKPWKDIIVPQKFFQKPSFLRIDRYISGHQRCKRNFPKHCGHLDARSTTINFLRNYFFISLGCLPYLCFSPKNLFYARRLRVNKQAASARIKLIVCRKQACLSFSLNRWCSFTRWCKLAGMTNAVKSNVTAHTESAAPSYLCRKLKTMKNIQCCSQKIFYVVEWCKETLSCGTLKHWTDLKLLHLSVSENSVLNVTIFCALPVVLFSPHYCALPDESSNI